MGILSKLKALTEPEPWLVERGYVPVKVGLLTWRYIRPERSHLVSAAPEAELALVEPDAQGLGADAEAFESEQDDPPVAAPDVCARRSA